MGYLHNTLTPAPCHVIPVPHVHLMLPVYLGNSNYYNFLINRQAAVPHLES
jgi:hypothetical protein